MIPDDSAARRARRVDAIDLARGLALVGMGVYHLSWDLADFRLAPPTLPFTPGMRLFSHIVASAFLILVGVSLALAHRRGMNPRAFWQRFAIVAGAAALVSAGSFVFAPSEPITFGILHCIAVASLVAWPFVNAPAWASFAAGLAAIVAPQLGRSALFDPPWLLWLGLGQALPNTLDWRPLMPWAGVVFLGLGVARLPSVMDWLTKPNRWRADSSPSRAICFAGRHSLPVYLLHQPMLIGLLWVLTAGGRLRRSRTRAPSSPPASTPASREDARGRVRDRLPLCRRRGRRHRRRRPAGDARARAPGRAQAHRGRLHGTVRPSDRSLVGSGPRLVQSALWVFLDRRGFCAKYPDFRGWICLDFLGFSRPNLDLSWVMACKASSVFSRRFCFWLRSAGPVATILACGKTGLFIEQRYHIF